ncbi:helix-hairpin-helix domain-containing protein [Salibacterium lacus]|uniref:Helix-hairpin-helix domain-containing protein n=1 Tax=Salibacterium lacus TaxID=1898109 RepID=A0ABW5SYE7_9BACI
MNRNLMYAVAAGSAAVVVLVVFLLLFLFDGKGGGKNTEREDVFWEEEETAEAEKEETSGQKEKNAGPVHVVIDVKGAVKEPGVYELKEGKRVIDAIDEAGGMTDHAEPKAVNFAEKLYDAMVVRVPEEGEEELSVPGSAAEEGEKVRINYAETAELETLPGIGPAKASAIISYREEEGFFESGEDLLNVSGIGEASLEQMKESLSFH